MTIEICSLFSFKKTFIFEQHLGSWFLDLSLPSPQVADLLNKAVFLSHQNLSLRLAFKLPAAKLSLVILLYVYFIICFTIHLSLLLKS